MTTKQAKKRFRRGFNQAWLQNVELGCYGKTKRQMVADRFRLLRSARSLLSRKRDYPRPEWLKMRCWDILTEIIQLNQGL